MTSKILLTGAGGFIGSHLAEALVRQGHSLRAFVRYNSRGDPGLLRLLDPHVLAEIELLPGDLADAGAVRRAVTGCELVYHLGALISIPYSYLHPAHVVSVNVTGTLNLLLACRDLGVRRIVHTSTSEVYGTARTVPISEDHPLQAQSPYSASKIAADKLCESFYCTYDLPVVTIRPFNTFGPRQSARAVLPTIISQAIAAPAIRLGALDTRRDFTYVSDTVAGFLLAGQQAGVEGQVFNLGTGRDVTIEQAARAILTLVDDHDPPLHAFGRRAFESTVRVDEQRLRPGKSEVLRLISDNRKARAYLGWEPRVEFEQGLGHTIDWVAAHPELFQPNAYQF